MKLIKNNLIIDSHLTRRLVGNQFPNWNGLAITSVESESGNYKLFRLGEDMLVHLPNTEFYGQQIENEFRNFPQLAPQLPLKIPEMLALGEPSSEYPWHWHVSRELDGEVATATNITNMNDFASSLADFLQTLHQIEVSHAPNLNLNNSSWGKSLDCINHSVYDLEICLPFLKNEVNEVAVLELFHEAESTFWDKEPVWIHGNMHAENTLVQGGKLVAVNNFYLTTGDPAFDLTIAWTFLHNDSRKLFRDKLNVDDNTWLRTRALAIDFLIYDAAGINKSKQRDLKKIAIINDALNDN